MNNSWENTDNINSNSNNDNDNNNNNNNIIYTCDINRNGDLSYRNYIQIKLPT